MATAEDRDEFAKKAAGTYVRPTKKFPRPPESIKGRTKAEQEAWDSWLAQIDDDEIGRLQARCHFIQFAKTCREPGQGV